MATQGTGSSSTLEFMIVGKTGVGKSSIINSVAGSEVAPEGEDLDIGTYNIESYEVENHASGNKIVIRFWDTPGLFDTQARTALYIKEIQKKYQQSDLILYCSDMTDNRVTEQDRRTVRTFTNALGVTFWRRAIFVLTFGNDVEDPRNGATPEYFKQKLELLKAKYVEVLKDSGVPAATVQNIPFVPAGYHPWSSDKEMYVLPDGKNWISTFFLSCFARVKQSREVPHSLPRQSAQQLQQGSRPAQPMPTREQCTFGESQRQYIKQDWFECKTCWGGNSAFGCCWPCALDCHRGHQLIRHHKQEEQGRFFCDCGLNKHQPAVCTYYSTKDEFRLQSFYRCSTCFSRPRTGICHQCMINCHRGHNTRYAGEINAFCDCGLEHCKSRCQIPEPM